MSRIVVNSSVACEGCGGTAERAVAERVSGGELTWWLAVECKQCGKTLESDGVGSLPTELRSLLLTQTGARAVLIEADDAVPVLARLREAFELEPAALMALKRELPGPVFRGSTPGEAERIQQLLTDLAEIVIVPDAGRGSVRPPEPSDAEG